MPSQPDVNTGALLHLPDAARQQPLLQGQHVPVAAHQPGLVGSGEVNEFLVVRVLAFQVQGGGGGQQYVRGETEAGHRQQRVPVPPEDGPAPDPQHTEHDEGHDEVRQTLL